MVLDLLATFSHPQLPDMFVTAQENKFLNKCVLRQNMIFLFVTYATKFTLNVCGRIILKLILQKKGV